MYFCIQMVCNSPQGVLNIEENEKIYISIGPVRRHGGNSKRTGRNQV